MKHSKYNIFFKHEDLTVGFNSYSQEFIVIDPLLHDLYCAGMSNNDFSELEHLHANYYNFLVEKGFLVEENIDEYQRVKDLSIQIDNNTSSFLLTINPTMNCNFKCWYCYETHIKDSKMDTQTIKAVNSFVLNVVKNQTGLKNFDLSFFGGEPLLYFDKVIYGILKSSYDICIENDIIFSSGMTTNGLLLTQERINICKKYNLNSFQITLDGNREQHDKVRFIAEGKGSFNKIVDNIKMAARNGLKVNVRINCSKETLNGIQDILESFASLTNEEKKYINFDVHKVWQVQDDIERELNDFRFLLKDNGYAISMGGYGSLISSCYADKRNQATINYNGEVFKCTARDFTNSSGEGMLKNDGSIQWNEKYERRLNSKFNNPPCKECKILPICGGGCTQLALENFGIDYCVHNFDENSKLEQVKSLFKSNIYELAL